MSTLNCPLTCREYPASRTRRKPSAYCKQGGGGESGQRRYWIAGTQSAIEARIALEAVSPITWDGLFRQSAEVRETGFAYWEGHVEYSPLEPLAEGEALWDADTEGGTAHISQALEHIADFNKDDDSPPNHKGAIGVTDDGDVQGCDIIVPAFAWTEKYILPSATTDWMYSVQVLRKLTGTVNDTNFRGIDARGVLFKGASIRWSTREPDRKEITFKFAAQERRADFKMGDIEHITKEAWDYLWCEYTTTYDKDSKPPRVLRTVVAVHTERVYEENNFGLLGVGTAPLI